MDKRLGCRFCFKTLDPSESVGNLRTFVKCVNCGARYHEACWQDVRVCPYCAGTQTESVNVFPPDPLQTTKLRKPRQSDIYGQSMVRVGSGPSATKVAISVITLIAVAVIFWRVLLTGIFATRDTLQNGQGSTEVQTPALLSDAHPDTSELQTEATKTRGSKGLETAPGLEKPTPVPTAGTMATPSLVVEPVAEVSADSLNVRSGPGTQYSKVGILKKGRQVPIIGKNNGWWRVRLDNGKFGWISIRYAPAITATENVPDVPAPPAPTPEPTMTPSPAREPTQVAVTDSNRSTFSGVQGVNAWSYLMEDGRNSGQFRPMPRFDGKCWRTDNWEKNVRICTDGEVHPGESGRVAYQWRAPNSGQLNIAVHAHKIDTRCGDGVWVGTYRVADERAGPNKLGEFEIGGGDNRGKTASYSEYFETGSLLLIMVDVRGESTCDMARLNIDIR